MWSVLVVVLRESLEAFLIVAITASCLRKTGQGTLLSAVRAGTVCAFILSMVLGGWLAQYVVTSVWEGFMALAAALLVATMLLHMRKIGTTMRQDVGRKIDKIVQRRGIGAWLGVFLFILLMVTREGMEVALVLVSLINQVGFSQIVVGGLIGMSVAAAVAMAWNHYGHRINLGLFFQVTGVFLWIFTFELFLYAFHEFCEAGIMPFIDNVYWHNLTEKYGPEGMYGSLITYSLVITPVIWLIFSAVRDQRLLASRSASRHISS